MALDEIPVHGYPSFRGDPVFRSAVARFMQVRFGVELDPDTQVLALSGAKEGLAQVAMSYCSAGTCALIPDICYPVHARAPLLNGADVHYLPLAADKGFLIDFDAAERELSSDVLRRAKIILVNYPNNPTGAVAPREFYARAVAFARKHHLVLVSDLAYSELTYEHGVAPSVFEVDGAQDVAVEFHSCSKMFNMAGLRLGFAVGNRDILDSIAAYRTNVGYGTPTAIQRAGAYAFDHYQELGSRARERYRARRDVAVQTFRECGWKITAPPATMYIWLPVPLGYAEWDWVHALLDRAQVVVTPGTAFGPGGAGYFRISLVANEEMLVRAIHSIAQV
jgi:LL-diaminopimelate aminotransferase